MAATAEVSCDGASGTAAPFVVSMSVDGHTVRQEDVTGQPVPASGGDWWSWSLPLELHGKVSVTVTDTAGRDSTGSATSFCTGAGWSCGFQAARSASNWRQPAWISLRSAGSLKYQA